MHCEKQMQGKPSTLLKTIVTTMNFVSVMIFFPLCLTCTHFWNCRLFVQYALRIFLKMRSQSMRVCVGIGNLFSAVYEKMLISNSPRKHMYFYFIFFKLCFVISFQCMVPEENDQTTGTPAQTSVCTTDRYFLLYYSSYTHYYAEPFVKIMCKIFYTIPGV